MTVSDHCRLKQNNALTLFFQKRCSERETVILSKKKQDLSDINYHFDISD